MERSEFEQRMISNIKEYAEPYFVSINNKWMYEDVPDQVHQIVVIGFTLENGKIAQVYFLDPSYTRQDAVYGGLKSCTGDELWKAASQNPEPGYVYYQPGTSERKEANPPIQLNKYLIPISQSVQEKNYYNGPACVQMVLRLHGVEKSQDELAKELNTSSTNGTEYDSIQRVVNKYCFGSENIKENQAGYHLSLGSDTSKLESRIRMDIASNDPIFIALDGNTLYEGASKGNHLVLLVGYTTFAGTDTIANYYFIDPWELGQDGVYGGLKIVTPEDLYQSLVNNKEPAYIW
ncbi:MAG: C39 family peptidase [Bacillota bacterium]|nr:C39 family peptidase [Bacillota bacterium]